MATLSGLQEPDYPSMEGLGVAGLNQRSMMRKFIFVDFQFHELFILFFFL